MSKCGSPCHVASLDLPDVAPAEAPTTAEGLVDEVVAPSTTARQRAAVRWGA